MQPGDVFAERFELLALAGQGGMGIVYRARDRRSGATVALKILQGDTPDIARFTREARTLASLSHPGIVGYVADGLDAGGQHWLAMEWLDGVDLDRLLERRQPPVEEVLVFGIALADALGAAHAAGAIHRDLKPSNVLLLGGDLSRPKLVDFGIARMSFEARSPLTRTGMLIGTPGYMSPEQARGLKTLDARADIYSLGCLLFEALTGRPAFFGESLMAVLAKVLLDAPPHPADVLDGVPPALDALVVQLMAKRPEERLPDAPAVKRALEAISPTSGVDARKKLMQEEQRLVCVIAAAPRLAQDWAARTPTPTEARQADETLRTTAASFGARSEILADGSFIAVVADGGAATDQVAQAARCALQLKHQFPSVPLTLCTGRGVVARAMPLGDAVDRAAMMLSTLAPAAQTSVWVDTLTVGLLDARFELRMVGNHNQLVGLRAAEDEARRLLGQATPCVGRDRELSALEAAYADAVEESGARVMQITAGAGVGKTRLRHELMRRLKARAEPPQIWTVRADQMRMGSPLGLIGLMIRQATGLLDGEPIEARKNKLLARLTQAVPAFDALRVAGFLGEVVGTAFPDEDNPQLRAARRDSTLMNDQVRRAFEDWLWAESGRQPLALLVEDLHWADDASTRLIDLALLKLKTRPLFVAAFARPEVKERFPQLFEARGLQELRLCELSVKASERLARHVLGPEADPALISRVVEQSAGNAFYLEELLRAVSTGAEGELPPTVVAMAQARLGSLLPEARALMRAASIFGQICWEGGIAALTGDEHTHARIEELVERELLVEQPSSRLLGQRELAFRHAYLHEAAHEMLTPADRETGHRLAGAWLAEAGEPDARTLADHFEQGGERAKAARWYRVAVEQALLAHDHPQVRARVSRAIACGATGNDLVAVRLANLEAGRWQGRQREVATEAGALLSSLEIGTEPWCRTVGYSALQAGLEGDLKRLGALHELVLSAPPVPEARVSWCISAARVAVQRSILIVGDAPVALLARLQETAKDLIANDPSLEGWVSEAVAFGASAADDGALALERMRHAAACFERAGDLRNFVGVRYNIGWLLLALGLYEDMLVEVRSLRPLAQRVGSIPVVSSSWLIEAMALEQLGRFNEGLVALDAGVKELQELYSLDFKSSAAGLRALLCARLGRPEEARAALEIARTFGTQPLHRIDPGALLGRAKLILGDPTGALAGLPPQMKDKAFITGLTFRPPGHLLVKALAHHALGELDQARAAIADANAQLQRIAEKISDPKLRENFLRRVPICAEIQLRAKEWRSP